MGKLLSISVAAYNVEAYLEQTLSSLTDSRYVDKLEVFVVDDGGTDSSIEIAREFEKKHPGTFRVVHKENGGYGTTVNYSIANATGKYFKLLDGDDWMDPDGLAIALEKLEKCSEDAVITGYYIGPAPGEMRLHPVREEDDTTVCVRDYSTDFPYGMWAIFYRTDLLRKCHLRLPEHTLYTDQLYSSIPFSSAETMRFLHVPVYCYRYGTAEQSTSLTSRLKHADEMLKVCKTLYDYYNVHKEENNRYLFSRISRYYIVALRTLLLFPANRDNLSRLAAYENWVKRHYPEIFYAAEDNTGMGKLVKLLRKTNYLAYWGIKMLPMSLLNQ